MANDSDPSPEPRREPGRDHTARRERNNDADRPRAGAPDSATGASGRLRLETTSADGSIQTDYRGDSHWHAMHRLARLVNQDSPQASPVERIELADRDGTYGVTARRAEHEDGRRLELQFQTADAQSLYRQVVRERQMELASPADNRIDALPSQAHTQTRGSAKSSQQDKSADQLRRDIAASLTVSEGDGQQARQRAPEVELQVLERATVEQLKELKRIADAAQPDELREALRALQRQIESEVGRSEESRSATSAPRLPAAPKVNERFTVQDRLGRRDYWYRDRPDRLAFTQTWLSLRTKEHSNAALMGMVDRAVELGWKRLHLEGTPEFKREAWILASSRGLAAHGYTATLGDREAAETERKRLLGPQREPADAQQQRQPTQPQKQAHKIIQGVEVAPEKLQQVLRKAIADAKVSPELESRLLRLLDQEHLRRHAQGRDSTVQVWDRTVRRARPHEPPSRQPARKDLHRDR